MYLYPIKSQGEDTFILFSPHSFMVFFCVIIVISTPCSITFCIPTPQQFLGLWYMVLQLSGGFQLATEQDTIPSVQDRTYDLY